MNFHPFPLRCPGRGATMAGKISGLACLKFFRNMVGFSDDFDVFFGLIIYIRSCVRGIKGALTRFAGTLIQGKSAVHCLPFRSAILLHLFTISDYNKQ